MEQSGSGHVFYGIRKLPYSQDPAKTSYPIENFSRHPQTLNVPILILSQNLRLVVQRRLFRSGFPTNFAEIYHHFNLIKKSGAMELLLFVSQTRKFKCQVNMHTTGSHVLKRCCISNVYLYTLREIETLRVIYI